MATLRQISKGDWTAVDGSTLESINCGSLQRIADAAELMSKNYQQLLDDRNSYERWYREKAARVKKLEAQITALRGVITRMKNKSAESVKA